MQASIEEKTKRLKEAISYLIGRGHLGISSTQKDIAEKMGAKNVTNINYALNGNKRYLTNGFLNRFNSAFEGMFSVDWILTGEGEMLKDNSNNSIENMNNTENNTQIIPLLPLSAQGGSLNDFAVSVKDGDCEKIISPIKGADFAITISGDSMAPEYPSGSKILIKKINEKSFIEWGRCYVLDTCNGTVIKKLDAPIEEDPKYGFDYVICVSVNPSPIYKPFRVPTEDIYGVYRVLMLLTEK